MSQKDIENLKKTKGTLERKIRNLEMDLSRIEFEVRNEQAKRRRMSGMKRIQPLYFSSATEGQRHQFVLLQPAATNEEHRINTPSPPKPMSTRPKSSLNGLCVGTLSIVPMNCVLYTIKEL